VPGLCGAYEISVSNIALIKQLFEFDLYYYCCCDKFFSRSFLVIIENKLNRNQKRELLETESQNDLHSFFSTLAFFSIFVPCSSVPVARKTSI
jgi:hypothetical protein